MLLRYSMIALRMEDGFAANNPNPVLMSEEITRTIKTMKKTWSRLMKVSPYQAKEPTLTTYWLSPSCNLANNQTNIGLIGISS